MGDKPLYDSSIFWVAIGGVVVVIGGILISVGPQADPKASLWANGWFDFGFIAVAVGAIMLIWALVLYLAHRQANREITQTMQAAISAPTEAGRTVGDATAHPPAAPAAPAAPEVAAPLTTIQPPPREPCELSPAELVRLFNQGGTELQSQSLVETYIGKWREVSGTVTNVKQHNLGTISVTATDPDNVTVTLFFDPKQWADQLRGLMSGDQMKAGGKVREVHNGHVLFDAGEIVE
jgi:uncharacterized protein YjeT (DUF2065 family)